MSSVFICDGCESQVSICEASAIIDSEVLNCCTPECLYQAVRKRLEKEHNTPDTDLALIHLLTSDLCLALQPWIESENPRPEDKTKIIACWERLEQARGQIELTPDHPGIEFDSTP